MPTTYMNKGKKIYYLHYGKTKTGKPRYHFSMKDKGNLMEKIPEGMIRHVTQVTVQDLRKYKHTRSLLLDGQVFVNSMTYIYLKINKLQILKHQV